MAIGVFGNASCRVGVGFQQIGCTVCVIIQCAVNVFADSFTIITVGVSSFTCGLWCLSPGRDHVTKSIVSISLSLSTGSGLRNETSSLIIAVRDSLSLRLSSGGDGSRGGGG